MFYQSSFYFSTPLNTEKNFHVSSAHQANFLHDKFQVDKIKRHRQILSAKTRIIHPYSFIVLLIRFSSQFFLYF